MHTAAVGTWALQDFGSYQISANSQTNHNTRHVITHTNQNLKLLRGDNDMPLGNSRTSKLQQLLGDPNDMDVKPEKSKNTLSKWFSSLKKRRKSKSSRPMVEILFDQGYSRNDNFIDQMSDNGFGPETRRRKYSDPSGTEKPLHLRHGSLDRREWTKNEIDQDYSGKREYGSLDRRTQSQILTRWNGSGVQDLHFDDAQPNSHQHHGSSSESEATPFTHRQQQSQDDFMTTVTTDRLSSSDNRFWSLPRQKPSKPYSSSKEPTQYSDGTSQDLKPFLIDNQLNRTSGNVEWSLPRNFKLKPNAVEGIIK